MLSKERHQTATGPDLFYRTEDILIGVGLWGFAFAFIWFAYGKEFWIAANKLEEHRANEIVERVTKGIDLKSEDDR